MTGILFDTAGTLTRRRLLIGAGSLGLLGVLPACAPREGGVSSASTGGAGPWEFTDDRGRTVTLDSRPERVVAFVGAAAALWDFGLRPIGTFGPLRRPDGSADPQAGNIDPDAVESLGGALGDNDMTFNVEQYAALRPDLLVTVMRVDDELWFVPEESAAEIEQVAPTIGIRATKTTLSEPMERLAELASALGADLQTSEVVEARARFDAAGQRLTAIAEDKPGLKVLVAAGYPDLLYVAKPDDIPELIYLSELGLDLIVPDDQGPSPFEGVSWEQADRYPADVIMYDARAQALTPEQMANDFPTWGRLPAVAAGQLVPWYADAPFSYRIQADILDTWGGLLKSFRDDLVS
ncbi:MAG: ABC transporter substrate-binding protein [Egibacteraceae bacterium]